MLPVLSCTMWRRESSLVTIRERRKKALCASVPVFVCSLSVQVASSSSGVLLFFMQRKESSLWAASLRELTHSSGYLDLAARGLGCEWMFAARQKGPSSAVVCRNYRCRYHWARPYSFFELIYVQTNYTSQIIAIAYDSKS